MIRKFRMAILAIAISFPSEAQTGPVLEISAGDLQNRITGGLLGQFFGNLNGLEHENLYTDQPGRVDSYTPDLSEGAHTDDDTDIEFVYLYHMRKSGSYMLAYPEILRLWRENINDKIWCSNRYARNLMELGIIPPLTGRIALNPWAEFNISGQFLSEQFGLISPGMPQTAARIGTHYTLVAIDGEPAQTTQLFDAMIARAFFEKRVDQLIEDGLAAVDPASEIHGIVTNVRSWYRAHPDDWKATRRSIRDTYWNGRFGGAGGTNGYRVTTASTIAALLHGQDDFVESLRLAFNFGWDADNVAAMVGTILGVLKGEDWIRAQGWVILDRYVNNRRPGLPAEMTITEFADLHFRVAGMVILGNGGEEIRMDGEPGFRITSEQPANVEKLPVPLRRSEELKQQLWLDIRQGLAGDSLEMARSVYYTICLGLVEEVASAYPEGWYRALEAFKPHYELLFGDDQWPGEAKACFREIVFGRVVEPDCPFSDGDP